MSRKFRFTPEEKEQIVIDYIEGNKFRSQICGELNISSRVLQVVMEYLNGEGSSIELGLTNRRILGDNKIRNVSYV